MYEILYWISRKVEPSEPRLNELNEKRAVVCDKLRRQLGPTVIKDIKNFGSISRGTAIMPADDLDVLLIFNSAAHSPIRNKAINPAEFINMVKENLDETSQRYIALRVARTRPQYHSVRLTYNTKNMHLDLVPALPGRKPNTYLIPEANTGKWITTSPFLIAKHLAEASAKHPSLIPALRLMKAWKRCRDIPLPSYALEWKMIKLADTAKFPGTHPLVIRCLKWMRSGNIWQEDPATGQELKMRSMGIHQHRRLRKAACETLFLLQGEWSERYMDHSGPRQQREMLKHFVGQDYIEENDQIKLGNYRSKQV